jgi:hypothetical protein
MTRKWAMKAITREVYELGRTGRESMRARIEGRLSSTSFNLAVHEGFAWRQRDGKPNPDRELFGFWSKGGSK